MKTPELTTDRLILRQIQSTDIQDIFNCWMNDEDVSRYMYWKSSDDINDTKEFVNFELEMIHSDVWYRWIIETKKDRKVIGTCLIYYNDEEWDKWDISYNLGKAFWGNGYITEAMLKVMDFAKNELGLTEIIAIHAVENSASGRVIEKLGFEYVKEVPYECMVERYRQKASIID